MKVWNQYLVDSRFFTLPSLMKMRLSLVLYSGIIVDHLAAENQVPKFAFNRHGEIRNADLRVLRRRPPRDFKFGHLTSLLHR